MRPVWLAVAALLLAYLVRRRYQRRLEPTMLVGGALAAVAMAVYGLGLVALPNLDELLKNVGSTLGAWTYLLVGVLCFLESGAFVGLLIPGETAIVVGGFVAGQGEIDVILLIAIAWTTAVAGDLVSFALGRRLGREFLVAHGPKVQVTEQRIEHVERFYDRHGGKAVFLGRWIGLVRAVSPFLAGSSGMPLRRFLPYDVLAAGGMVTAFALLGYVFWHSLDQVLALARKGLLALGITIALVVAIIAAVRWLRDEGNRRRLEAWLVAHEQTPVLAPAIRAARAAGRRLARPARFAWDRLTPGELGLELTTLLAVVAVGSFVFFGYVVALDPITRLTAGDLRGARWSSALETPWLTDVAKALTQLGTLPVAGGVLIVTALVLMWRRRGLEGLTLLGGLALTCAGVHLAKAALDRPRPLDPLVDTTGSAYPSGHAAYAVCWVAVAVALRHAFPGLAARAALLATGIAIAVAVGLTRIYLRAHWFSDVAGGWGLGATCFALAGMVALVAGYLRGPGTGADDAPAHASGHEPAPAQR
ncbi:MAG TPA: VTT domain-containing protein [Conexibacter sp.]|jgi:membrane protein DedA with SNARE-associated domain/membrane-associated phospholipid phosphatase|nr:VTT domain-containing protein [Conexibacter sp.]